MAKESNPPNKQIGPLKPLPKPVRAGIQPRKSVAPAARPTEPPPQPSVTPRPDPPKQPTTSRSINLAQFPPVSRARKPARLPTLPPVRKSSVSGRPRKRYRLPLGLVAACMIVIVGLVALIWSLTNKNAYAVYLGQTFIGNINKSKEIEETAIKAQAVIHLETALGASVQTFDMVTLQLVHSGKKDILTYEDAVDAIARHLTYKIAATAIIVEGQTAAILKTAADAAKVEETLQAPYMLDSVNYVLVGFTNDYRTETVMVDQEALETVDDALLKLDKKIRGMKEYTIVSYDTLGGIALKFNTTVDKICADNPGYTAATLLQPGNKLQVETIEPYLSVITVEEQKRIETVPMSVRQEENPNEYKTYTKVLEEGKDGEQEVTVRITRINGIISEPEVIVNTQIITAPVDRVLEVGTSEVTPQRR